MELSAEDRRAITDDVEGYLRAHAAKDLLRFITCGSVDDGKSTLMGRLLYDSKLIYADQLAAVRAASARKGADAPDLSLLTDGLRAEREQGITIDVAYRYFTTRRRKFVVADTPGHEEYTRNMVTGASTADLAVILVDAQRGVLAQTKRHAFIASLLGIRHVVVAINKMDLVGWSEARYQELRLEYAAFAARLEVSDLHFVPLSALYGDNVVHRSTNMSWFAGAPLLDFLEKVHIASDRNLIDLRFPIQHVLRPSRDFRGYQGTLAGGVLRVGDEVLALPSRRTTRVARIVSFDGERAEAFPPQAVTVTLTDDIDLSRGDMLVHPNNAPRIDSSFEAMVVWMQDDPLRVGRELMLKSGTQSVPAGAATLRYRFDVNTLRKTGAVTALSLNEVGRVVFECTRPLMFDAFSRNKATGSLILIDRVTHATVGAAMIVDRAPDARLRSEQAEGQRRALLRPARGEVDLPDRERRQGHKAATVWLTGLPRAGKSTIAYALEKRLWDAGVGVHVLDGVNVRLTLSRDLGFGSDGRSEAIRRAAEVARMFTEAGMVTVAALASPHAEDRSRARAIIGAERCLLVWLRAPLDVCEARDAALHPGGDGLYARARRGEITAFTGISAPYEPPQDADLVIDSDQVSVEDAVTAIMEALGRRGLR